MKFTSKQQSQISRQRKEIEDAVHQLHKGSIQTWTPHDSVRADVVTLNPAAREDRNAANLIVLESVNVALSLPANRPAISIRITIVPHITDTRAYRPAKGERAECWQLLKCMASKAAC